MERAGGDLSQGKSIVRDGHRSWTPGLPRDQGGRASHAHRAVVANSFQHPWLVGREAARAGVTPLRVPVDDAGVAADCRVEVPDRCHGRIPLRLLVVPPKFTTAPAPRGPPR